MAYIQQTETKSMNQTQTAYRLPNHPTPFFQELQQRNHGNFLKALNAGRAIEAIENSSLLDDCITHLWEV